MRSVHSWFLALPLWLSVGVSPGAAQELKIVDNAAGGFSIELPAAWTPISIPDRLICQSAERSETGLPAVAFNLGPDTSGKTFAELREEHESRATRKSTADDVHVFSDLAHEAGPAFTYTRTTTTRSGKKQAARNTFVEAGKGIWMLNWVQVASDDPTEYEELWGRVVASFRAP